MDTSCRPYFSAVRRWALEFDAAQAAGSVRSTNQRATADAERICALEEQLR